MRQDKALLDIDRLRLAPDKLTLGRGRRGKGRLGNVVHRGTRARTLARNGGVEGLRERVGSELVAVGIQLRTEEGWRNAADTAAKAWVDVVGGTRGREAHIRRRMLAHVGGMLQLLLLHVTKPLCQVARLLVLGA
jgi:hypothetical protein